MNLKLFFQLGTVGLKKFYFERGETFCPSPSIILWIVSIFPKFNYPIIQIVYIFPRVFGEKKSQPSLRLKKKNVSTVKKKFKFQEQNNVSIKKLLLEKKTLSFMSLSNKKSFILHSKSLHFISNKLTIFSESSVIPKIQLCSQLKVKTQY